MGEKKGKRRMEMDMYEWSMIHLQFSKFAPSLLPSYFSIQANQALSGAKKRINIRTGYTPWPA